MRRRQFIQNVGRAVAAAAVGPVIHARAAKADKGELVVVSWGGSLAKAQRKAFFEDFERQMGIKVRDDTPPLPAKVKAMVESGNVTWDIVETDLAAILTMVKDNLLDPIDYAKLDKAIVDEIPAAVKQRYGVGSRIWSFNIVYNTGSFPKGKHPRTWAQVWDGKNFPGVRTFNFGGGVQPQLEFALLADGVPRDKLYPIDVERAWGSMSRLRPLVRKWYSSHSEAIQLVTSGEAAVACTVGPRGITAKRDGAPVDVEYNEGELGADHWCLVRGSANRDAAMKFINFALAPERQAILSREVPYGPTNRKAFDHLSAGEARDLASFPENAKTQFWWDPQWWGAVGPDGKTNEETQEARFATWMVKGG
jgi:putative spermidine/putrescine transport system substrate-binding protein